MRNWWPFGKPLPLYKLDRVYLCIDDVHHWLWAVKFVDSDRIVGVFKDEKRAQAYMEVDCNT